MKDVAFAIETKTGTFSGVLTVDTGRQLFIDVGGRRWRMFWSDMWGPCACDKNGDPLRREPGPNHEFWRAATLWSRQGRRVDGDVALWHEPAPEILQVVGQSRRGREVRVIQAGEDIYYSKTVILPLEPNHD